MLQTQQKNNKMQSISHAEYLKIDAISRSDLLAINRSIKYYLHVKKFEIEETESLKFGRMLHKFVLEHDKFYDEYHVVEKIDKRTKAGKELYAAAKTEAANKEIINDDELQILVAMRDTLLANEIIKGRGFLENVLTEQTILWDTQAPDGENTITISCKCRPDIIRVTDKSNIIIDLKTCCNIDDFVNEIFTRKYHMQAAFYSDAYTTMTSKIVDKFLFIAIEKEPPYLNKIFVLNGDSSEMEQGRLEYRDLLVKYVKAKAVNFTEKDFAETVVIPNWYRFKINN